MSEAHEHPSIELEPLPAPGRTSAPVGRTSAPVGRASASAGRASAPDGPPSVDRAALSVLDVTEYYAEQSGGIRTYLQAKARYVESHAGLRQVLVVPGARARVEDRPGVRRYELWG